MGRAAVPPERLLGDQRPTHKVVAPYRLSRGHEAIELARIAGIELDEWQQQLLVDGLGVAPRPGVRRIRLEDPSTWMWSAFQVGVELARQNGKSAAFEVRALAGVYLFGERLVVYTAHKGETAMNAFKRLDEIVHAEPELAAEVDKVSNTNGKEFIRLRNGAQIKFRTRTTGGGRGLAGDCTIFDEGQDLGPLEHDAVLPVLSARPNPQAWYGGSAGTQDSVVQGGLVRRCNAGDNRRLTYYRWAGSEDDDPADPRTWARLNPAFGRRITAEYVEAEQRALDEDGFARERMTIGDYPRPEGEDWVIPRSQLTAALDENSCATGGIVLGIDVRPSRSHASMAFAGWRRDRAAHVEVIRRDVGTRWVVPLLKKWCQQDDVLAVVIDEKSQARTLLGDLVDLSTELGFSVIVTKTEDYGQACGDFREAFAADPPAVRHAGGTVLLSAIAAASTRRLGDSEVWARHGKADITPLVAATLALRGLHQLGRRARTGPPPAPQLVSAGAPSADTNLTADLASLEF